MLIKNLSYDCNKVSSFLNFFRVFRYLNFYVPKGVRPNPLNPHPPSYASESIYRIKAHVTRDREFMVAHNCHGKNKNLTAITKYLTAKPNASRQKQNSLGFAVGICFCRESFGVVVRYFVFAVRFLFLPWGFRFCREVFCFCREVFGFAVRYFVFAVRFLVLPWQLGATAMRSSPGLRQSHNAADS